MNEQKKKLVAVFVGIIVLLAFGLLAWDNSRMHAKIDELSKKVALEGTLEDRVTATEQNIQTIVQFLNRSITASQPKPK